MIFYHCPKETEREERKMNYEIMKMLKELHIPCKKLDKVEFCENVTLTNVIEISAYVCAEGGNAKKRSVFVTDTDTNICIYGQYGGLQTMITKKAPEYITLVTLAHYLGHLGF